MGHKSTFIHTSCREYYFFNNKVDENCINNDDKRNDVVLMNVKKLNSTTPRKCHFLSNRNQSHNGSSIFNSSTSSTKTTKSDICGYCLNNRQDHDMKDCIKNATGVGSDSGVDKKAIPLSPEKMNVSLGNLNETEMYVKKDKLIRSLIHEIAEGNTIAVKKFIKDCHVKVDDRCPQDIPILFYAIKYDRTTILEYMLTKGVDIYQDGPRERNILHFTIRYNKIRSFKLIYRYISDLIQRCTKKKKLLNIFSKRAKNNIMSKLASLIKQKDADGNTPLHLACRLPTSDVLQKLLVIYFKIIKDRFELENIFQEKNNDNETILHVASSYRSAEVIYILFEKIESIYYSSALEKTEIIISSLKETLVQMISWHNSAAENLLFILCKSPCICIKGDEECKKNKPSTLCILKNKNYEVPLNVEDKNNCENCFILIATFVRIILKYRPETFNTFDNQGRHPLSAAAIYGNLSLLKQLIELVKIDPNIVDKNNRTPLHHASSRGFISIVKYLTEKCKVNMFIKDDHGVTALHYATIKDYCDIIEILLLANRRCDIKNSYGHTSLMWAVINGCLKALEKIILLDPIHCKNEFDYDGFNAVHLAVKFGQVKAFKMLIENGWDICTRTLNGLNVIQVAIKANSVNMLEILLNDYIPIMECDDFGNTLLHTAASNKKYLPILDYVLKRKDIKSKLLNSVNKQGKTPINYAASLGCTGAFKLLLMNGADVNIQDDDGCNAFMSAAKNNMWSILMLAIDCKIDYNAVNEIEGKTLLDYVLEKSNYPVAMFLRQQNSKTLEELIG
uniref:Inversin (inferred by orthology to a human protein) n=1 Tax=Strongyloides venezuelensis TaxID=75913 RepID=A0A0K0G0L4_STRVS